MEEADSLQDMQMSQSVLRQQRQGRTADISQREREITDIASSIIDLATMFKDISAMVIDQGTLLDRIDYNVERTLTQVKTASEELKAGAGYQRRSSRMLKRCFIILLICLCIMLVIILITKSARR